MTRILTFAVAVLLCAPAARAQSWELSALAGSVPAADLEQQSRDVDKASIGGGFLFTIQGARLLTPNWGVEVSFTQQYSSYDITMGGVKGSVFSIDIAQLHGDVVYEFGESGRRLRPFVFGGLGATLFTARDLPGETKLSFGAGGGAKMFVSPNVGIRAQVGYRPVVLGDDAAGDFCDPFGFCQSMLRRFDFAAGVSFRF
jgi:opacity protein-like surface antigen